MILAENKTAQLAILNHMKSKQLANVLIKILGLYFCLCAIPSVISGIVALFPSFVTPTGASQPIVGKINDILFRVLSLAIGYGVLAMAGIFLIIKSRKISEFWFKNEDE